jgi:hypothetical protein
VENPAVEKTVFERNRVQEENCYFPYQENGTKCCEENEEEEEGELMMDLRQERINERRKRRKKHSISASTSVIVEPSSESVSLVSNIICCHMLL